MNKDEGVQIDNTGSSAGAIVQVLGTNIFTGNTGDGLNIRSDGNITLNNITADANTDNGIDIDNTSGTTNATFTINGTNSFSNNVNTGINVLTEGAITLSNIVASGNTAGTGAYLVNDYTGAGGVTITGTAQVGQVLTGTYSYSDAENDPEGTSTYRWLRGTTPISGATARTYTLTSADQGALITFEVTPVATLGTSPGTTVTSAAVGPVAAAVVVSVTAISPNSMPAGSSISATSPGKTSAMPRPLRTSTPASCALRGGT